MTTYLDIAGIVLFLTALVTLGVFVVMGVAYGAILLISFIVDKVSK